MTQRSWELRTEPSKGDLLPRAQAVLAVVAHPDDESFGLGAVISPFVEAGSQVDVLCLTEGEKSTLGAERGDLGHVRACELADAAAALDVTRVHLHSFPDGSLADVPLADLESVVTDQVHATAPDLMLVLDAGGVTGHPDHVRATEVAVIVGHARVLPVLAWTLPSAVASTLSAEAGAPFYGRGDNEIDLAVRVSRSSQREAITRHSSQVSPGSVLWRRLGLLGDAEYLRWL